MGSWYLQALTRISKSTSFSWERQYYISSSKLFPKNYNSSQEKISGLEVDCYRTREDLRLGTIGDIILMPTIGIAFAQIEAYFSLSSHYD